jgi:hypothetical protein
MAQEHLSELTFMGQPLFLGRVIAVLIFTLLFFCSKSYDAKRSEAISEYRYWCADHNLKEDIFAGPKIDSTFFDSIMSFRWSYYRNDFKDTLHIIVAVKEKKIGLRAEVYREGDIIGWRKILKSKY